jgi:hypothetical protein
MYTVLRLPVRSIVNRFDSMWEWVVALTIYAGIQTRELVLISVGIQQFETNAGNARDFVRIQ